MGIFSPGILKWKPCITGVLLVVLLATSIRTEFLATLVATLVQNVNVAYAATDIIRPNGDGTVNATDDGNCSGTNASCINEVVTTADSPGGTGFLTFNRDDDDFYLMGPISGVDTVSRIDVHVYHQEGATNMQFSVELWDATETTTQYGTTQTLTTQTASAQWNTATFSGLSMTDTQLDGLRVRLLCSRISGGSPSTCDAYALYADVEYTEVIDVSVATTSVQQNLRIGTTSAHVGGAFVISEDTGSRNLTGVTITETGTVDAANDLSNIKLFYEQVADCSAASYNGTETQFGSTDSDGFSTANGTSSFTGTVAITTANDLCLYVVLDVDATASIDETLEIEIADVTTSLTFSGSPSVGASSTPLTLGGTTVLEDDDLTQFGYHWRNDNGSETGATSATSNNEDTVFNDFPREQTYRLRVGVSNEGNISADPTQFRLEYATSTGACAGATGWEDVAAVSGAWDMSLSNEIADGNTSNIASASNGALTDPAGATFLGTGALRETTSLSGSLTLSSTTFSELEYSIEATSNASDGSTYCFRVTDNGTPISYDTYPEASIASDLLVTASSSPSQITPVTIPSTNQELGPQIVITDSSAGSHTVSSITLHASGTVDLQNDIDNLVLFYELDTTTPYDCTGESYNGDETQYGATSTNGFSAGATSTFSGSFSVSPTQGVCLYVKYDVSADATDGESFEVFFNNAADDLVIDTGTIAPAATVDLPGYTKFAKANVVQTAYHWRDNTGTEATAGSLTSGVPNTTLDELADTTVVRLRFGVANTGGVSATNYQYRLEWAQKTAACDSGTLTWIDMDTGSDDWAMVASQLDQAQNTSNIATSTGGFSDTGTFAASLGQRETTSQTGNITISAAGFTELEYSIEAQNTIPEGSSYCFRLTDAGTILDDYTNYPEATIKLATDFLVTRDTETVTGSSLTLTEGVDYDLQFNDASRAFIRITNSNYTGGGPAAGTAGNLQADETTAYISNPGNITTSVNITRSVTTGDTVVSWEVVEYIGAVGGENEMIVRSASTATYGTAATQVTTGAVSGVVDDTDIVVFITGQQNPDSSRFDYNTGISTAAWNAGADTTTFTRGEAGSDAVNVGYAVVEFTGANWSIQRAEMNYDTNYVAGFATTTPITLVDSTTRAFVHAQHRAGSGEDQHADFGHEAWVSSIGNVSFILNTNVQTPTLHTSVAWVIENKQTTGDRMVVTRTADTIAGSGGGLTSTNVNITKTLDDITTSSIFLTSTADGATRSFPEPLLSAEIISDTQYNLQISDDTDSVLYRTAIVEWPTAARKLFQNDFRIYEDNDGLTPTVARGGVVENQEMAGDTDAVALGESVRIRMSLRVTAASMPAGVDTFMLEYSDRPEGETCVGQSDWYVLGDTGSTTAAWRGQAGTPADGATLPSVLLSESTTSGTYEEENPTAVTPSLALVNDVVEYDWNVEHNGAADKTDYCFRMVEIDRTLLEGYDTFPLVRTAGYEPILSRWQWFDDENSLEPSVSLAGENVTPTAGVDDNELVKLRVTIAEVSGAAGNNIKFALEFSEYADFATSTTVIATSTCLENSLWCYADGAGVDNERIGTALLSDAGSCTTGTEPACGTRNEGTSSTTATFDHTALTTTEYEFTLQSAGARVNAVYYFRLYDIDEKAYVPASTTLPSLIASSSRFTLGSTDIIPGDTVDTDFTADATSTASTVEFGSVPFNTQYIAAQRFTFDTNATEGYQVFVYTDGLLTNTYGGTIPAVTGTNASPANWLSACPGSQTGCFGYHSGDDSLAGGSVRFAAQDTFAAFTTSPEEVFYSSVPGSEVHDMVYSIEIGDLQPAGDYVTNLTYIVVPVF